METLQSEEENKTIWGNIQSEMIFLIEKTISWISKKCPSERLSVCLSEQCVCLSHVIPNIYLLKWMYECYLLPHFCLYSNGKHIYGFLIDKPRLWNSLHEALMFFFLNLHLGAELCHSKYCTCMNAIYFLIFAPIQTESIYMESL